MKLSSYKVQFVLLQILTQSQTHWIHKMLFYELSSEILFDCPKQIITIVN